MLVIVKNREKKNKMVVQLFLRSDLSFTPLMMAIDASAVRKIKERKWMSALQAGLSRQ